MNQRLPNLFLVGVAKCASTSLWEYLVQHPEVYGGKYKEPGIIPIMGSQLRFLDKYKRLFDGAGKEKYLLDGSVRNSIRSMYPYAPARIKELCPDAKILFILRDPFERLVSHFRYCASRYTSGSCFLNALKRGTEELLANSLYPYVLEPFFQTFDRENILVVTTEELQERPYDVMSQVFNWLGLERLFDADFHRRFFQTTKVCRVIDDERVLGGLYMNLKSRTKLARLVPSRFKQQIRNSFLFSRQLDFNCDESFLEQCSIVKAYFSPLFHKSILELESMLGRSFDMWPSKREPLNIYSGSLRFEDIWVPDELQSELDWLESYHSRLLTPIRLPHVG